MIATAVIFNHDKAMVCLAMIHSENRYHIPCASVPSNKDPMMSVIEMADHIFGKGNTGHKWFLKNERNEYNDKLDMNSHRYVATCVANAGARPSPGYGWVEVDRFHEILIGLDSASDYAYVMDSILLLNNIYDTERSA